MGRTIHWLNNKPKDTACLKIWWERIEYEVTRLYESRDSPNVQREQVAPGGSKKLETVPEEDPSFKMLAVMIRVLCGSGKIKNCHGKNRRIDTLGKRLAAFLVQPFPFITIRGKKEGNQMEIADIRNQLNPMNENK